jgi:diaminohydroxyphosphoribosylaminopyrimidine deaminase/5-amino-6-(5-phosphoribosylamino)uracil reductase
MGEEAGRAPARVAAPSLLQSRGKDGGTPGMLHDDERFMRRALELARRAASTSPNPRVGAVLVRGGEILAEGFHEGPGGEHAEAAALAGADARAATLYVNLEPCTHHGRTPPCAPALVAAGIARVVVAHADPDPRVSGRGLELLAGHGVEVTAGVLAPEALTINRAYVHHRTTGRPLVTLKLALTLDGRLSAPDGSSRWISGEAARARVHELRARADAVMVGAGTILADDPRLTARGPGEPRQPARVVVDAAGRVPATAAVFASGPRTVVATTDAAAHEVQTAWKEAGAEVVVLGRGLRGADLGELLERLGGDGITELLCEGGGRLATSLLAEDLVDVLELHVGPVVVGRGGAEIGELGVASMGAAPRWAVESSERVGDTAVTVLTRATKERACSPGS